MTRSALLLETFDALEQKDYTLAQSKTARLQALDETSVFLTEMAHVIRANDVILKSQKLMNEGKYKEAETLLTDTAQRYGAQPELTKAIQEIRNLGEIMMLMDQIQTGSDSLVISASATRLMELTEKNKELASVFSYAKRAQNYAMCLDVYERDRALMGIATDWRAALGRGSDNVGVLAVVFLAGEQDLDLARQSLAKKLKKN